MARRQRFSRIEQVPLLQTAYTRYKQWQDRTEPTSYTRSSSSNPGGYIRVAVTPFGADAAQDLIIKASRRANTELDTLLGARIKITLTGALRLPGFEPAKVVVFRGTGGDAPETSKITGLSYNKRTGSSYVHGFGAGTATEREVEAQSAITEAVMATANSSISFTPERFYQN
jgi:hypothetical protein